MLTTTIILIQTFIQRGSVLKNKYENEGTVS